MMPYSLSNDWLLLGSDKQRKWAHDIATKAAKTGAIPLQTWIDNPSSRPPGSEIAKWWIDNRYDISGGKLAQGGQSVGRVYQSPSSAPAETPPTTQLVEGINPIALYLWDQIVEYGKYEADNGLSFTREDYARFIDERLDLSRLLNTAKDAMTANLRMWNLLVALDGANKDVLQSAIKDAVKANNGDTNEG